MNSLAASSTLTGLRNEAMRGVNICVSVVGWQSCENSLIQIG